MITRYVVESYTHLVCLCVWHRGMQQGAAMFMTPCWGMGTPMAWRQTPAVLPMLLPLLPSLQVRLNICQNTLTEYRHCMYKYVLDSI